MTISECGPLGTSPAPTFTTAIECRPKVIGERRVEVVGDLRAPNVEAPSSAGRWHTEGASRDFFSRLVREALDQTKSLGDRQSTNGFVEFLDVGGSTYVDLIFSTVGRDRGGDRSQRYSSSSGAAHAATSA